MFKAIFKVLRALGYLLTGRVNKSYETLAGNSLVIGATYDSIIESKKNRLNEYQSAIAVMIASEEKKKLRLEEITKEIEKLQRLKTGALSKAKEIASKFNNDEAVKKDAEYLKCQSAYKDFTSSLNEKEKHALELENDLKALGVDLLRHKNSLTSLVRELEKIKTEKGEAQADIISAQESKKIAQLISGISTDETSKDLEQIRDFRNQVKAEARTARELAGVENENVENEFLEYATHSEVEDEFDRLIGITKKEVEVLPSAVEDSLKVSN